MPFLFTKLQVLNYQTMAIFKSGNPALNVFENTITIPGSATMTERGTMNKFFLLSLLVIASASLRVWQEWGYK